MIEVIYLKNVVVNGKIVDAEVKKKKVQNVGRVEDVEIDLAVDFDFVDIFKDGQYVKSMTREEVRE